MPPKQKDYDEPVNIEGDPEEVLRAMLQVVPGDREEADEGNQEAEESASKPSES